MTRDRTGTRRRRLRGALVLIVTALPWAALALLSRTEPPGADAWIGPLMAGTLIATYAGLWAAAMAVSRRPRAVLLRAAATTFTLLVMLVLLELSAKLRWVHWAVVFRKLAGEGMDYTSAYVLDSELVFRRIPGMRWSGRLSSDIEDAYNLPRTLRRPITFTYDRWGYRNATEMEQADVVLLGDSYVEGWYVSDDETVAARLAARLDRPVANLGVAGYGTLQELRVFEGDAMRRRPKVVAWFFFEGNDLYDDHSFESALLAGPPGQDDATPRAEGLTRGHGWRERSFARNAFHRIRRLSHPLIPNRVPYWATLPRPGGGAEEIYFFRYAGAPWRDYEEERWAIARAALEQGVAFARERDIGLVFLYVPIKFRVYEDLIEVPAGSPMTSWKPWPLLPVRFHDFCESTGVDCLDLTDRLRRAAQDGGLPYPLNDTHWSPQGHAIAAAAIEDLVRERRW